MKNAFVFLILPIFFFHCGEEMVNYDADPIYKKILTAERDTIKFEVYSLDDRFLNGYNELHIKVIINNAEVDSGHVKFTPVMHKITGGTYYLPRSERFTFETLSGMFSGYVIFFRDSLSLCQLSFNYNDEISIDSVTITLGFRPENQLISWNNINLQKTFLLTLVKPVYTYSAGSYIFELMFHSTNDSITYENIDNAEMFIKPWMPSMGHGSANNVHPALVSPARYRGTVNFNMPGEWYVYDSIKVNGNFITQTPPPYFIFQVW